MPIVVMVTLLIASLGAVAVANGRNASTSSGKDRNHDIALGVAEAGVHQAIAKIEASEATYTGAFSGDTPQGVYDVTVTRENHGFIIDAIGTAGGDVLGRTRHIRVSMMPPPLFGGDQYAMFSNTSIQLKNNDEVTGDIWANDSVHVEANAILNGALTAARGWVDLESNSEITESVWSGGFHPDLGFAIRMANGARIGGWAKASVTAPSDPDTCGGEDPLNYTVDMNSGSLIEGDLTTWGSKTVTGAVNGTYNANTCTPAAAAKPMPVFTFNKNNYDPDTYREFGSVGAFQSWLDQNGSNMNGTFYIQDSAPSAANRIDMSGASLNGDTTIVTNAPVFTNGIDDDGVADEALFVLVSTYAPPAGTACELNNDASDCVVHVKNNFDVSCDTATLIYAPNGPVAVKNNLESCGTIIGDGVLVKNNQGLHFDDRLSRVPGFGGTGYEVALWEELPT